MTEKRNTGPEADREGAALWARARDPWRKGVAAPAEPDPLTLAAYLEGRLDEAAAAPVEAWMVADPEALDSVLSARAALAEAPPEVPRHVTARARHIVCGRAGRVTPSRSGGALFGWFTGILRPAVWAGATAAVLLASVSGFELGRAGVENLAALDAAVAADVRLVMGPSGPELL